MNEEVIIDVKIDVDKAINRLELVNRSMGDLKGLNKQLAEQIKQTGDATGELSAKMAVNNKEIELLKGEQKSLVGQLQLTEKQNFSLGNSYDEINASLKQLQKEYKALDAEQRESEGGKQLLSRIQQQKDKLKELDYSMGDFQRNVGNYPKVVTAIVPGFDKLNGILAGMGVTLQDVASKGKGAFTGLGQSLKSFGKLLITPPIAIATAIFTAIYVVVKKLAEAFKRNDDAGTALATALASLKPIGTLINKLFDGLATVLGNVALGIADVIKWIGQLSPAFRQAQEDAQALTIAEDDLQEKERQYTVNSAERTARVSELRAKAMDKEKYTAKEREQLLQEAIDLEKKNLEDEMAIKEQRLKIIESKYKQEVDTSDYAKNEIAKARADLYNAEQSYNDGTRRLQQQLLTARRENNAEEQQLIKQRIDSLKAQQAEEARIQAERFKAQNDISKALEDAILESMAEGYDKRIAEETLRYEREIEALEQQYKDKSLLTEEAEQKLTELRKQLADKHNNELNAIYDEQDTETENLRRERLTALNEEWQKIQDEINKNNFDYQQQRRQEQFDAEIEQLRANLEAKGELTVEEQTKFDDIIRANQIAFNEETQRIEEEQTKKQIQNASRRATSTLSAFGSVMDGIGQLAGAFAKDDKERANQEKILSLGKVAVSTGIALAQGIAQAQSVPFPANIGAIATTTGTILANIATAISTIKGAKFATGGIVDGTSYTGDRVTVNVNSGEMIINKEQQKQLFEIANGRNTSGIDYEALALAMSNTPAPILDYREFNDFTGKVTKLNELATI